MVFQNHSRIEDIEGVVLTLELPSLVLVLCDFGSFVFLLMTLLLPSPLMFLLYICNLQFFLLESVLKTCTLIMLGSSPPPPFFFLFRLLLLLPCHLSISSHAYSVKTFENEQKQDACFLLPVHHNCCHGTTMIQFQCFLFHAMTRKGSIKEGWQIFLA